MSDPDAKPSLLVVDDTVENLQLLTSLFREHGYEARPVPSGKLALLAIEAAPPDLILLDITMPQMSGYELCAELKSRPETRDIPVIFVSALDEVIDKVKAFAVGGVDYLTKPFQVEEVLARVRTHLALRRTQRELETCITQLRALEQLRDSLVNMVVHDLRSPAWGIELYLETLREQLVGKVEPETITDLDAAMATAGVLGRLVGDLLDVSRIENDRMPLKIMRCDLSALVALAIGNVHRIDARRKISIDVAGEIEVRCDRDVIRRVVENLVGNGLKHTPKDGALEVSLRAAASEVRVEVRDHGRGIPEEMRERIFEKYGVVESRPAYHSTGLGLAFARLAVEAHGGRIGVDSVVGEGSTFWFTLPGGA